jgi:hypothetical protein
VAAVLDRDAHASGGWRTALCAHGPTAPAIEQYAALRVEAQATGAQRFVGDEAHFRAAADLHGRWVLKGHPALVDSTCPRWGEQASYYAAVGLATGEPG